MELGSYFLFLQEQVKDIIIIIAAALAAVSPTLLRDRVVYWYSI